jgi:hypothetical protein
MKHKHAELIKAWADGAEIQVKAFSHSDWEDVDMKSGMSITHTASNLNQSLM